MRPMLTSRQVLKVLAITAIVLAASPAVPAEVTDSAADGFTVRISVTIHAAPADVYKRLVGEIGNWWSPGHTFSGDAHNLSIDERPMGCFCEKLPNQGAVRHMEVIFYQPGKTLRMSGALGPMQALAASAVATFGLSAEDGGTKLTLTYAVGGYSPQGLNKIAPIVDTVLTEQITRLKNYIETGDPAGKDKH
jgi:uncharacterized protein YndB with AHSA1/START domain